LIVAISWLLFAFYAVAHILRAGSSDLESKQQVRGQFSPIAYKSRYLRGHVGESDAEAGANEAPQSAKIARFQRQKSAIFAGVTFFA
jgi:hypothetical protein